MNIKFIFITSILIALDQGVKLLMSAFIGNNIVVLIPNFLQIELEINNAGYLEYFTSFFGVLKLICLLFLSFLGLMFAFKMTRFISSKYYYLDIWVYFACAATMCFIIDCLFWRGSLDFIAVLLEKPTYSFKAIFDIKDIYISAFALLGLLRLLLLLIDGLTIALKEGKLKRIETIKISNFGKLLKNIFLLKEEDFFTKLKIKTIIIHVTYAILVFAAAASIIFLDYARERSGNFIRIDGTHINKSLDKLNINYGNFAEAANFRLIRLRNPLKDADLEPLGYMTNLAMLKVMGNEFKDMGKLADVLSKMPNLTSLWLTANQINDITALSDFTQLEYLYLSNNDIGNVDPLFNLTTLKELYLIGNPLFPEQIEELKAQLPNTEIYSDYAAH
ncbi:MAG: leucine-rich repeat domain-containing protein [Lachnospiraceae bacterium]|nr:leucine-rich repeat domain-containing protein [Lachnospiraceae bacterium]